MRKILFALIFSAVFLIPFQIVSAQTDGGSQNSNDNSSYFDINLLKSDYEQAFIVAYVDVREIISVGSSDDKTDCVNFTGIGYCSFRVRAVVKEVFKGKIRTKKIEFSEGGEARLIGNKERFLGEKMIFLETFTDSGKTYLQTIENSTRRIEYGIVEKMRKIAK